MSTGALFETWVEGQHAIAVAKKILFCVEKTEPHQKIVRGQKIFARPGISDYIGVLHCGRAYAAEAKSSSTGTLLRSRIRPMQAIWLSKTQEAGGLAVLLVEFTYPKERRLPDRFAIPWQHVPWRVRRSAESVAPEDLEPWRIVSNLVESVLAQDPCDCGRGVPWLG